MRVSLSALRTLQRIRAATTADARWLAWKAAHPHVRRSLSITKASTFTTSLVYESAGSVALTAAAELVLAGADAQRRATAGRR